MYRLVYWFDEKLQEYYGDDNGGLIYGVYHYDDLEDFPIEVEWFASEEARAAALKQLED